MTTDKLKAERRANARLGSGANGGSPGEKAAGQRCDVPVRVRAETRLRRQHVRQAEREPRGEIGVAGLVETITVVPVMAGEQLGDEVARRRHAGSMRIVTRIGMRFGMQIGIRWENRGRCLVVLIGVGRMPQPVRMDDAVHQTECLHDEHRDDHRERQHSPPT